jgi:hypothetical protein
MDKEEAGADGHGGIKNALELIGAAREGSMDLGEVWGKEAAAVAVESNAHVFVFLYKGEIKIERGGGERALAQVQGIIAEVHIEEEVNLRMLTEED